MKLRLLLMMMLVISSINLIGCDDDDDTTSAGTMAGTMAGEMAGTMAGEMAGTMAGEMAGTMAGEMAGEVGGTETTEKNIVEIALETEGFDTLVAAVTAAGLVDTLSGEGPFTVLAPNDEAFSAIPADVIADLLADAEAGGSLLADILGMHVVAGAAVMSGDLTDGMTVTTLNGDLTVGIADGTVTFSNDTVTATVIAADVMASNGVIHVIDTVITAP